MDWTVVRPGGLSNDQPEKVGNVVVSGEDTLFGVAGDPGREISRDTVSLLYLASAAQSGLPASFSVLPANLPGWQLATPCLNVLSNSTRILGESKFSQTCIKMVVKARRTSVGGGGPCGGGSAARSQQPRV